MKRWICDRNHVISQQEFNRLHQNDLISVNSMLAYDMWDQKTESSIKREPGSYLSIAAVAVTVALKSSVFMSYF
jgi:hypothetical protein